MDARALFLTSLLLAVPATGQELRATDDPIDPDEVPPGSREDQLLYASLRQGSAELQRQLRTGNEAIHTARLAFQNLDVIEKAGPADAGKRVRELRARLEAAVAAVSAAVPKKPLAGCRYTLLHLEDSMIGAPGSPAAKRLDAQRREAQGCDRDLRATLPGLTAAVAGLHTTIAEVAPEIRARRDAGDETAAVPAAGVPAAVSP